MPPENADALNLISAWFYTRQPNFTKMKWSCLSFTRTSGFVQEVRRACEPDQHVETGRDWEHVVGFYATRRGTGTSERGGGWEAAFEDREIGGRAGFFGRCLRSVARDTRQKIVSRDHKLSVRRQCSSLTLTRSNLYYEPKGESAERPKPYYDKTSMDHLMGHSTRLKI